MTTVTRDDWSVSVTTGSGIEGAILSETERGWYVEDIAFVRPLAKHTSEWLAVAERGNTSPCLDCTAGMALAEALAAFVGEEG